jgi:hypothetical protein
MAAEKRKRERERENRLNRTFGWLFGSESD